MIPLDWKSGAEDIEQRVFQDTKNGSIILLHDGDHKEEGQQNRPSEMVKALSDIIKGLKKRGFNIVRLDEMKF